MVPDHLIVVFDEAYFEFVDSADYPDSLAYVKAGRQNIVVLRTFSKVYGIAGIRLGYAIAQPDLLAPLRAASESFPVNRLAQVAGLAALEDSEFAARTVAMNAAGRTYLYREFDRLGLTYVPSHTNFILVKVGNCSTVANSLQAKEIFQKLLARGVIVRPCTGYDLPEYLRVTVGTEAQNARFIAALEAVTPP